MANSIAITNPRTGEPDFQLICHELSDVMAKSKQLRLAQKKWWQLSLQDRIKYLQIFAQAITALKPSFVEALIDDTGRANESMLEVDVVIGAIDRWCRQAPELLATQAERSGEIPFLAIKQSYLPYPVVGIISPWNFPLLLSLVDAIPALLAGCSVLLKPSEVTSRVTKPLIKAISEVPMLAEVFSVVTGGGQTGEAVSEVADLICFTGSVATGRKVGEACAKRFIPAFLELGGKDPAIVCEDADLDVAAKALCWGSMVNAGQSCMSLERVYVNKNIADAFIAKLVTEVKQLSHNFPNINQGEIGPIIAPSQVDIVKRQLADAKVKGAQFLTGGRVVELGGGYYCQPTIVSNISDDMDIINQETFAAILPVVIVDTDQEAIRKANNSDFGLSAAVFSQNVEHAEQIALQLEAGAISINDASLTALVHEAEKQSFKYSGLGGSRMGNVSIHRFMRKKAFIRNTGVPSPWWF
ncbi:aldehyde dehydrogenase family protein [Thalassotalea sp. M1531]|uniref:Aldehyde dehydrogenase n=1 Tax=Thalassotalea algicola TaxID=2716224 RepID=A0A7Y0Q5V6_9GAMM|nr:aldehyde dehydrogenase family protein [Thalassotalea algicola]NMP30137.1 aldehyde dehydrogenase family protein [Thalassotalea algicola]